MSIVGKILQWNSDDGESHCISLFVEQIDGAFYLAERLEPRTGERLGISHVVFLGALSGQESHEIFDDWDSYLEFNTCDECAEEQEEAKMAAAPKSTLQ